MLWIGLSIVIYWLGHLGIYKFAVLEERKKIRTFSATSEQFSIVEKQKNEHIIAIEKILIEDKNYLDASLTLEKVADQLQLSKSHLSRIINTELKTSFTEYLNALRVEEAKRYLANPDFSNYTLVAVGLEAGFNSKSTFNLAFKKLTGLTPSQFKKTHSN
jgi:AraC-like DNA-binding protein